MSYKFKFLQEFKVELFESFFYYDEINGVVAGKFINEVYHQLNIIQHSPKLFPVFKKNIRRTPLRKFPFVIFYEIFEKENLVAVHSIYHTYRKPKRI